MKRARRGVSPVIATVLLILVAVAATVIIWTWVSGASSNNPTTQPALQEKLVIDAVKTVKTNATTSTATIYVTNVGQVQANITAAFVLDGISGTVVCSGNLTSVVPLNPGGSDSVDVTGCSFSPGHPYTAKVVSSRGISATYNFNG